jgi:hypothetical protein
MNRSVDLPNQFVTKIVSRDVVMEPSVGKDRHCVGKAPRILNIALDHILATSALGKEHPVCVG